MNIVSQRTTTARAQRGIAVPAVRPPLYVRVMLPITLAMAVLVGVWTLLVRPGVQPQDAFSDFVEILPGQAWNENVAKQFSCEPDKSAVQGYCFRLPAAGPFLLVAVSLSDGVVSQTDFSVHEGALTVGDLALLWGRPNVRLYRQSVNLDWPSVGVTANGWAESWQFSYSIPVQRISFAPPS